MTEEECNAKRRLLERLPKECEIQGPDCDGKFIYPCHRHNRALYKKTYRGKLWDWKHVISGCTRCHNWMDSNKERREYIFVALRGRDD